MLILTKGATNLAKFAAEPISATLMSVKQAQETQFTYKKMFTENVNRFPKSFCFLTLRASHL